MAQFNIELIIAQNISRTCQSVDLCQLCDMHDKLNFLQVTIITLAMAHNPFINTVIGPIEQEINLDRLISSKSHIQSCMDNIVSRQYMYLYGQLALTTLTWQGVQVFLTAYDRDSHGGSSQLAEAQVNFTTTNTQLGVQTPPTTYSGPVGDSNITITFLIMCAEYWYGRHCNVWCQNVNCMCDLPVPCHNNCLGVVCGENRHCVDGVDVYVCTCDRGFTGRWCEINIDECEGVNCSGNGRCIDGVDSFYCECDSDFGGTLCEIAIADSDLRQAITQIYPHSLGNSQLLILWLYWYTL